MITAVWTVNDNLGQIAKMTLSVKTYLKYNDASNILIITNDKINVVNSFIDHHINIKKIIFMDIKEIFEKKNYSAHYKIFKDNFLIWWTIAPFLVSNKTTHILYMDNDTISAFDCKKLEKDLNGNHFFGRKLLEFNPESEQKILKKYLKLYELNFPIKKYEFFYQRYKKTLFRFEYMRYSIANEKFVSALEKRSNGGVWFFSLELFKKRFPNIGALAHSHQQATDFFSNVYEKSKSRFWKISDEDFVIVNFHDELLNFSDFTDIKVNINSRDISIANFENDKYIYHMLGNLGKKANYFLLKRNNNKSVEKISKIHYNSYWRSLKNIYCKTHKEPKLSLISKKKKASIKHIYTAIFKNSSK